MKSLFRKKSIADCQKDMGLRRCLSAFDLTMLGIGAIIGTGIFVLTGHAAAEESGPAVVLSFVVSGIACAFAALAYSELSASVGGCGSAYGYSYAAFGEFIAWIIGWDLVLEYGVAVAAVANGWSGYFNSALKAIGVPVPDYLLKGPFATKTEVVDGVQTVIADPGFVNLPAVVIIMILMALLITGTKESARLNTAMVFIKLATICVFIAVAVFNINPDNWTPFMPYGWFTPGDGADLKPVGILAGASVVFFAYVGFDAVSTAVEEAKNPQKDVPIGILASLAFCTVIYIIVSGLLTSLVPYTELKVSQPVAFALERLGINWASGLVSAGVIMGLTTVMLVLYYGLTRIILTMSNDGLLPPFFSKVDEKNQTPVRTTVLCGLIMAVMAGFIPLGALAELVNIGTLAAFVLVCIGVIVLRKTHPDMPRPFKVPGGIIVPLLGVFSCGALICFLPFETHLRFLGWLAVGVLIYFCYSMRHSKLAKV